MALRCGISPLLFYDLTVGEVEDMINAYIKKEKDESKFQIISNQIMAKQIVEFIAVSLDKSGDARATPIWDYYPTLFDEEKKQQEIQNKEDELEKIKSMRKRFVMAHNGKIEGGGDD